MFSALLVFHDLTMKVRSCINSTFCSTPALPCRIPTNTYTHDSVGLIGGYNSLPFKNICPGINCVAQADQNLWSSCLGLMGAEKIIGLQSLSPVYYLILVICNKNSSY